MKNSTKQKIAYGFGDVYGGGAFLVFSLLYMNFLILVEGLPIVATTTIVFIGKLWDAVTDPVVGRLSDKTRSRFGRRRIYFLLGILPVFLSFIMLFYSFGIESTTAKIIYHTFAYMFFGTAFTIVMVPYNAILSDMTSDYNERTAYTTVRMLFSGGASLLCAVIPGIIIKSVGSQVNSAAQKPGYLAMAIVLAAAFGLCWLMTFLGTKEKENPPEAEKMSLGMWLSVFKNKPYRNFLGIFLTYQIAIDLMLALLIFYVDIVVLKYESYELIVGVLLVCSMALMPVMGAIAKRKGKAFPLYIGLPAWILTMLAFIPVNTQTPVFVFCAFAAFIALGSSSGNLSTWSMLTDIYDVDEVITGKRREGIYSGITTFLRKISSGAAVLILGVGLKTLGFDQNQYNLLKATAADFDPTAYTKTDVVFGIKWMFIVVPIVLMSVCLFFAIRNRINNRRFDAVQTAISAFHTAGNLDALTPEAVKDVEYVTGIKSHALWGQGKE